ncbi:MAG TPA: hypothetical protein VK668_15070 [Mucilaginibacter sp.]|nr:hypothetical protein [Mucilaginibacter sp.]
MKKLFAISMLLLHLFSLYGHMALYAYCVYQSNRLFDKQISQNNYKIDDLVEVKVPVNMPTIQNWKEYVYISGQVKFKENSYNYVKLKMTRDTVYLMCVPNYSKTKLSNQNIIDARKIADIPFNKKAHVPFGKVVSLSEYNYQLAQFWFLSPVVTLTQTSDYTNSSLANTSIASPGQPPEAQITLS